MSAKAWLAAGAAALLLSGAALAQANPFASLPGSVTLVLSDGLMLVEDDHGVSNSRTIKIGDEYRDGWKLEAVAAAEATFKKGNQIRKVGFESKGGTETARAPEAAAAGPASLTNADPNKRLARPQQAAERARIDAAVKAGDARQAYALGGSATDVARALAAMGGPMADALTRGEASFLNVNGRTGLRVEESVDGRSRNFISIPPELADTEPPANAIPFNPSAFGAQPAIPVSDGQGNTMIRTIIPAPGGAQ